jgi:hypothetical protein
MKTAARGNQNCSAIVRKQTELMERKARIILLNHAGWKARKHPAKGGSIFLDIPLYRTNQSSEIIPS